MNKLFLISIVTLEEIMILSLGWKELLKIVASVDKLGRQTLWKVNFRKFLRRSGDFGINLTRTLNQDFDPKVSERMVSKVNHP